MRRVEAALGWVLTIWEFVKFSNYPSSSFSVRGTHLDSVQPPFLLGANRVRYSHLRTLG